MGQFLKYDSYVNFIW